MKDDDELKYSPSSSLDFGRAREQQELNALRDKVQKEKGKQIDPGRQSATLKTEVSLKQLQQDLAGQQDEEQKRLQEEQNANDASFDFATKSTLAEADAAIETADKKLNADDLIAEQQREEAEKDEAGRLDEQTQAG